MSKPRLINIELGDVIKYFRLKQNLKRSLLNLLDTLHR